MRVVAATEKKDLNSSSKTQKVLANVGDDGGWQTLKTVSFE